jgi:two-component sensor histidine kinase
MHRKASSLILISCPSNTVIRLKYQHVFNSGTLLVSEETTGVQGKNTITETRKIPILENNHVCRIVTVIRDITEQKQAEGQIIASLKEKETLLHEIHHRVKNNMQVINSLLKLQSNNIEDAKTKEILKDSQSRVYAMSAVHETLHGSEKLSEINLQSYLSKIITSIFQTYSTDSRKINLNSDIDNSPISLNQAYPLGLIINELMSNSLKYAFPKEREGEVSVSLKKVDKELELIVMDDGIGIPDKMDWKNSKSLGLKLVRTLVENQLDGSIDMESNKGTKFTIKFNVDKT